jgi:hypothetical protein
MHEQLQLEGNSFKTVETLSCYRRLASECKSAIRACERSGSGAENGAERAEKLVSGSGAVSGTSEKKRGAERSAEREFGERERSGERAISSHKFP